LAFQRGQAFTDYIEKHNLSIPSALLISSYADYVASPINSELRCHKEYKEEAVLEYERLLNRALKLLPPYSNDIVFVMFKNSGNPHTIIKWFETKIGKIVQFPNFLSSSQYKWPDYDIYLKINTSSNSNARYIAPLTNKLHSEKEVLFMSNSKFQIKSVDKNLNTINLIEVNTNHEPDILLSDCFDLNNP
jgi:hypothetical protein